MWTNQAYDEYYAKGRTTQSRLQTLQTAANAYFVNSPNQLAESDFDKLIEGATGFAARRHEVAHGIVRPIQWYGSLLPTADQPPDGQFHFCLVPPHYQRTWIKKGKPEYIYTSLEMNRIGMHLFQFPHEVMHFRFSHLPDPRLSPRQP
jgi:hypothetical protein